MWAKLLQKNLAKKSKRAASLRRSSPKVIWAGKPEKVFTNGRTAKRKKGEPAPHANYEGLGRDLVQPLVDECEVCVKEGIVADANMADIGVIFGTGFAPFLGGPLKARRDGKA